MNDTASDIPNDFDGEEDDGGYLKTIAIVVILLIAVAVIYVIMTRP